MANQFQLFLLLILTKSSMPDRVVNFITDTEFLSFSFSFLNLQSLPGISSLKSWMDKEQAFPSLAEIGVESGSTFFNNFTLIMLHLLFVPLHVLSLCLPK